MHGIDTADSSMSLYPTRPMTACMADVDVYYNKLEIISIKVHMPMLLHNKTVCGLCHTRSVPGLSHHPLPLRPVPV